MTFEKKSRSCLPQSASGIGFEGRTCLLAVMPAATATGMSTATGVSSTTTASATFWCTVMRCRLRTGSAVVMRSRWRVVMRSGIRGRAIVVIRCRRCAVVSIIRSRWCTVARSCRLAKIMPATFGVAVRSVCECLRLLHALRRGRTEALPPTAAGVGWGSAKPRASIIVERPGGA